LGLTNATLSYIIRLAEAGLAALQSDTGLREGLNIYRGQLTQAGVAESFSMACSDAALLLSKS
jgi:alanine dehydrogenase